VISLLRAAALLLALHLAAPALAEGWSPEEERRGHPSPVETGTGVIARSGIAIPEHQDVSGFDQGHFFELAVDHQVLTWLAVEGSIGLFDLPGTAFMVDPTTRRRIELDVHIFSFPLSIGLRPNVALGPVHLHGLAGVALNHVAVDFTATFADYPWVTPYHELGQDDRAALLLGAGASSVVAQRWTLGAEARYFGGSARVFGATNRLDSLLVSAAVSCWF
jgi:opacity protein-like surface antigen